MNNISNKNKPLKIELLYIGGVLTHTSRGSTKKPLMRRSLNMVSKQSLSDKGRYNNNSLSHNIYNVTQRLPWHKSKSMKQKQKVIGFNHPGDRQ